MTEPQQSTEPLQPARRVSIIVPTLNEADNVDPLIEAVLRETAAKFDLEILIADGGSTDGTQERVRAWHDNAPVRLVEAGGTGGLAGDVLAAAREAAGDVVVVMDADFSHPPSAVPDLVQPILDGTSDMVVGSRYVPGGATPDWPLSRRLLSRAGGALAWPLTELADPMSGFFAVRRERLLAVDPTAAGFKIGLEVIAEGGDELRLSEVPIVFRDRVRGESKIGFLQMFAYIRRLMVLAGGAVSMGNAVRFGTVGLIGLGVDIVLFEILLRMGLGLVTAHISSFAAATVTNYVLNSRWAFADTARLSGEADWQRYLRFLAVCLMALFFRGGVLAMAINGWGWPPEAAIVLGVFAAAGINYCGNAFFIFPSRSPRIPSSIRWRIAALGVFGYMVLLRLVFLGLPDLLPEEAYYWNYAQHLDIGYLDHPPMVAWFIWLGTSVFGDTEFGVRIGAFLVWLVTAGFCFQLTRNLYGKSAAFVALALISVMPFFTMMGALMMPDAPLTAAWAGALYFLERALLAERRAAWWGAGLCIGLGMVSKYTIALLGPAALVLVLLDPRARRWLLRPEPYLGAVLAVLVFSPVIIWNANHDWASFMFQGPRRLEGSFHFSLPELIGTMLVVITPFGVAGAIAALLPANQPRSGDGGPVDDRVRRRYRFIATFTLVPLSVFMAFSLAHSVKLNWTGPLWLAVIPAIAAGIIHKDRLRLPGGLWLHRTWAPTITVLLVFYGLALHYLVLGLPGVGYTGSLRALPIAWAEFGRQAAQIEKQVETASGQEPLLVGMDRYFLSSELAFYLRSPDGSARESVRFTAGRGLFGQDSGLMYDYWFPTELHHGKTVIMFGFKAGDLKKDYLSRQFASLGPVEERLVKRKDAVVGRFYYRIGYDFKGL